MKEYTANRISNSTMWKPTGTGRMVEAHSWRRGHDKGKRRLTYGIYGTEIQVTDALTKNNEESNSHLRWTEFRNGKFMVW